MSTQPAPENYDLERILGDLRGRLSRVHHDLNNPLSIVSGNAQLIRELAKALRVEEEFIGPLDDLEAAVERMTESADALIPIRRMIVELQKRVESEKSP